LLSFVAFSLKRAWQGFWRNAVMSIAATATMVLMLVLLSTFFVVLSGLDAGLQFVEQKVEVVAELRDDAPDLKIAQLRQDVAALPEVASVDYIDKPTALAQFKQRMAERIAGLTGRRSEADKGRAGGHPGTLSAACERRGDTRWITRVLSDLHASLCKARFPHPASIRNSRKGRPCAAHRLTPPDHPGRRM